MGRAFAVTAVELLHYLHAVRYHAKRRKAAAVEACIIDEIDEHLRGARVRSCFGGKGNRAAAVALGNRVILQVYNKYLKGKNDKRWRIEHAQVINEKDFDLFGRASVIQILTPIRVSDATDIPVNRGKFPKSKSV